MHCTVAEGMYRALKAARRTRQEEVVKSILEAAVSKPRVNINIFSTRAPQISLQKVPFSEFEIKSELAYIKL